MTEPAVLPPPPPHREADVVVADGGTVHLRPILPSDAESLVAFHAALSTRTRYLRYFSAYPRIPERDLIRFTTVDHHDRVAFIALLGQEIIAVGRYERAPGTDEAEVAFVVADRHQGRGIGSVLLEHLAAAGRESGIRRFNALVLAENSAMIRVFRQAGYNIARHMEGGEVTLEFDIDETALTESVMREREQRAEARSIRRLLAPASVAVVGASNDRGKLGNAVFLNLLRANFSGTLYPVNADARHVNGVRAYASVLDIPDSVDLVVLAVPAAEVVGVVEQCAQRDVRGLVIISGGFGERGTSEERKTGRAMQRELVSVARSNGMRVIGPNCLGMINTDPAVALNASLAALPPLAGKAGFFAQSGALGAAVLGEATRHGLGVSTFVSAGNRADVSGNDLLQYWESDDNTDIALLYLESFGNPRKFARVARRLGRRKPIVAVKSGRGPVVAGLQHLGVAVPESSVQALFEASGVIRVDTLGDMFDVAILLAAQPLPAGGRVSVVSNSTALAVLVENACQGESLSVSRVVDVGTDTGADNFGAAVAEVLDDDTTDALVALFVPPLQTTSGEDYAAALRAVTENSTKPVLSTFLGFDGVPAALSRPGPIAPTRGSVPSYPTPERAVRALGRAVRYARWRQRPPGVVPELAGVDHDEARVLIGDWTQGWTPEDPGRWLDDTEIARLLGCYGIGTVPSRAVVGLSEAQRAARDFAAPVAIRVGGRVRLHLADSTAIAEAWLSLDLEDDAPATVQVMAPRGTDVVLDLTDDRSFGALVSFGLAGVATDLLGDRAFATVPLTGADAQDLVRAPRAAPVLTGYDGAPPANLAALSDLALRLSALSDDLPEVLECSLRVVASSTTASVLSASARIAVPTTRADTGPRRLRGL